MAVFRIARFAAVAAPARPVFEPLRLGPRSPVSSVHVEVCIEAGHQPENGATDPAPAFSEVNAQGQLKLTWLVVRRTGESRCHASLAGS